MVLLQEIIYVLPKKNRKLVRHLLNLEKFIKEWNIKLPLLELILPTTHFLK